uniref:Tetrahydrofolate dehydrogenase/cyclohydrolase catalytic domain-containing protein n=1 Tax=Triticum urartu TaxID=4572 RepID=A0A8R7U0H6_TRIUA
MKKEVAHVPGLAIVLVGDRGDSQSHVRFIVKGCEEVGIKSLLSELPQNCTKDEVVDSTSRLNGDPSVHGILLRLPLPQVMYYTISCTKASSMERKLGSFNSLVFFSLLFIGCRRVRAQKWIFGCNGLCVSFFFNQKLVPKVGDGSQERDGTIVACAQRIAEIISYCLFKKH